jgi:hypothetical protein
MFREVFITGICGPVGMVADMFAGNERTQRIE